MSLGEFLASLQGLADEDVPLAMAALHLAAADHPGRSLGPYEIYLRDLPLRVRARHHDLIQAGSEDDVTTQLAALKFVLVESDGFAGDTQTYDDLQNADLMAVIDRRRGLPIALAIIYLHAARGAGMVINGLNFPGHFLVRLDHAGRSLIVDPFAGCRVLQAADLRALIKQVNGAAAELHVDYYQPCGNRAILTRLQNNLKTRLIAAEDYTAALRVVERMRLIDPNEYRLYLDAGVLYARLGEPQQAVPHLQDYLAHLPPRHPHRRDAEMLLAELLNA
jgi:regulator of sirC expression with transglutaminase-like and TPR domain